MNNTYISLKELMHLNYADAERVGRLTNLFIYFSCSFLLFSKMRAEYRQDNMKILENFKNPFRLLNVWAPICVCMHVSVYANKN